MVRATSQQQQLSEFLGEFNCSESPNSSTVRSFRKVHRQKARRNVNEMQWAPGFIELTQHDGVKYRLQIAQILDYSTGTLRDAGREITGSGITLVVGASERFVLETPEQITDLIRDNWEKQVSGEAAMGAEYGTGDYKIGKDGWK